MNYIPQTVLIEHFIPRTTKVSAFMANEDAIIGLINEKPRSSMREVADRLYLTSKQADALLRKLVYCERLMVEKSGGRWHGDTARNLYSVSEITPVSM